MPYAKDSTGFSLLWGRIGAAVLLLAATGLSVLGYTFSTEAQADVYEAVASILAALALLQVAYSKIRESKKVDQAEEDLEALNKLPAFKDEK